MSTETSPIIDPSQQLNKINQIDQSVSKMKEDQIKLIASQKSQLKEQKKIYSTMRDEDSKAKLKDVNRLLKELDGKIETVTGRKPKSPSSVFNMFKSITSTKTIILLLTLIVAILFIIQVIVILIGFTTR